ncbi:TDP-N-acetylfucosamine:lipid II N-acetylfucosaminyltransferase [Leifsonia sp. NPDC058248]|uniref:TDP-N-acetylfucosamine:lipid II N-acetylfucosaminyltransferase n=1 Tax=Leifsonia sp. NPDC058248 TaxID=3346402 RepID=UPI0036DD1E46
MPARRPLKIVHIGPDSQFLQFAANVFESVAPGANEYLVVGSSDDETLRHPIARGAVHVVSPSRRGVVALLARRRECDLIVAHSMTPHAAAAFARARPQTVTVWSGFGFDYYGNHELLGPQTRELAAGLAQTEAATRVPLRRAFGSAWYLFARRLTRRAAARADYFSAPVPTDEPVFRSQFPQFHGQYSQLNYASLEETFATVGADREKGGGVLVGNSATPSNNHLEAFELLAGRDLGGRRIIVPLNYGDPTYRDAIAERGTQLFGAAFLPLIERMPLDEYNELVAGCDIVIMNQRRQQGLGNIGTALYAGATIFLDDANPVYEFLRQAGASVRSTSELRSAGPLPPPLSDDELAANHRFLESFWGAERVRENVAALIGKLDAVTTA